MAWLITWLIYGMAIALATRAALRVLPGTSAATRYVIWWGALVVVVLLPLMRAETPAAAGAAATVTAATAASADAVAASLPAATASTAPAAVAPRGEDAPATPAPAPTNAQAFAVSLPSLPSIPLPAVPDWLMAIVIGVWLGGVMLGLAQVLYSLATVRDLRRTCRPLIAPREAQMPYWSAVRHRGRAVRVRASQRVRTAAVLGLVRPIIAVPRSVSASLTPDELDQVLLHEYAHVQRFDDWTRLLQVIVSAFAGWHPAVRLIMREIDFEREAACDDWVVDTTGAARAYARCLTKVVEITPSAAALPALTYATSAGGRITTRIERLVDDRSRTSSRRLAMLPALTGAAALAMFAFATVRALPLVTDTPTTGTEATDTVRIADDGATAPDLDPGLHRGAWSAVGRRADAALIAGATAEAGAPEGAAAAARREPLLIARASMLPWPRMIDVLGTAFGRPSAAAAAVAAAIAPARPTAPPPSTAAAAFVMPQTTGAELPDAEPMLVAQLDLGSWSAPEPPPIASRPSYLHHGSLGPVLPGGDASLALTAESGGAADNAWGSALGATGRGIGAGAKKAGTATASATTSAANGVKVSAVKTAKTLHRVTGSILSKLR